MGNYMIKMQKCKEEAKDLHDLQNAERMLRGIKEVNFEFKPPPAPMFRMIISWIFNLIIL